MGAQARATKVAKLEALRSKALALGGPIGHLLTRSFDLMTNVVRSGDKDRETLEYTLESFANERAFAEKRDEQRDSELHHVLFGLTEGLEMMGQAILEERKEEEARIDALKREAMAESSADSWRNEASPDYDLGSDEPLNMSVSTRWSSSSTAITQEEQPACQQVTTGGSGTTPSFFVYDDDAQTAPIRSLLDYYNDDDCVTLDDSDDDEESAAAPSAAVAAVSATTVPPAAAVGHAVTSAATPSPAAPAAAAASVADAPTFAKTEPDHEVALDDDAEDEDPGEIIVLEESVQCKLCDLWVKNRTIFKEHLKETHKDVVLCDVCGEVFTAGDVFEEHMKTAHEEAVQCDLCGAYVADREVFVPHLMSVHGIDPFADDSEDGQAAEGGDAAAAAAAAPTTQQASTSAAPAAAAAGGGEGENKGKKRRRHEDDTDFDGEGIKMKKKKMKTDPAPRSRRSCTLGVSFKEPEDIVDRPEDFIDGLKHQCPNCDVTYTDLSKLRKHMREVHQILPYACGTCEAKFAMRKELVGHLKKEGHQEHRLPENGRKNEDAEKEKKDDEKKKTGEKIEEKKAVENAVGKGDVAMEGASNSIAEKATENTVVN